MKAAFFTIITSAGIGLLAGCASQPVTLSPVGPGPEHHAFSDGTGYLRVYSDTETHVIGDGLPYYPHTCYNIYDQNGVRVKFVPNHIGNMDESPTLVSVNAGNYNVVAQSSAYGRVTVPVVIEGGRQTIVHLDRQWQPAKSAASNDLVRFPDGEAIGWSGATAQSSR